MNIYLDMDDVVADWMGYARDYLKQPDWKDGEMLPDATWRRLKDDHRMYSKLPIKTDALKLVSWVTDYAYRNNFELRFLTAIPHNNDMPWSFYDKVNWADQNFPHIPVFFGPYSHDKWKHCQPGDVLIDDRRSNCEEWERAGGIAHIYKNWPDCKEWLEENLK